MRSLLKVLSALVAFAAGPVAGHEFWIEPVNFSVAPGALVTADLRVGEMFEGTTYSYFPDNFLRFDAGPVQEPKPVAGRMGDRPAMAMQTGKPGLWVIVHETTPLWLTYDGFERFVRFTDLHDLSDAQQLHTARGLPSVGFREMYYRHAKALVAVGDARRGADRRVGLLVEIVAETNPYAVIGGGEVTLRMYETGTPRANAQIEIYVRTVDGVEQRMLRSDGEGRVTTALPSGAQVMANFTTIAPLDGDPDAREAVWMSRWASLTFAMP
ncbi:DUF4198 domain-containing protein [Meridianimarinicoccus aquatilis]|uniref:DUF4198 domain-containing protein n=1 Tax=Meridianimarinicoccus aquatilis TaxID=2552766 RepID=A0A4R6AZF4_9RHOB|nr:DUF4198 domain-containing protein [Fluviibacterium aquatile]TDL87816.1 DUF4198 domain-containing protein [Fluviibacterium aquatile]